jgi:hypothetical protein
MKASRLLTKARDYSLREFNAPSANCLLTKKQLPAYSAKIRVLSQIVTIG